MSLSPFTQDPSAPLWSPQPLNLSLQSLGLPRALGPMILFSFIFKNQSDHVPPTLNLSPGPRSKSQLPGLGLVALRGLAQQGTGSPKNMNPTWKARDGKLVRFHLKSPDL